MPATLVPWPLQSSVDVPTAEEGGVRRWIPSRRVHKARSVEWARKSKHREPSLPVQSTTGFTQSLHIVHHCKLPPMYKQLPRISNPPPINKQPFEIFDSTPKFGRIPFISDPLNGDQGEVNGTEGTEGDFEVIFSTSF